MPENQNTKNSVDRVSETQSEPKQVGEISSEVNTSAFTLKAVETVQIQLLHNECGGPSMMIPVQNSLDSTKPNKAVLMCHKCNKAEIFEQVDWDLKLKVVQEQAKRASKTTK